FARVLLDDAIAVAGNPDIVLVIDEAAVDAVRQLCRVTPRVYYVTMAIVFDHRRGRARAACLSRAHTVIVTAVDGENVVARVDAGSGDLTRHPGLTGCWINGERFRPEWIDDVSRNQGVLRDHLAQRIPYAEPDDQSEHEGANIYPSPNSHSHLLCGFRC